MGKNRIGYACMNNDTYPQSFKTCRIQNITNEKLIELIQHNLEVLEAQIDYNITHGNRMYRVSSSLIPFASSELNQLDWMTYFAADFLRIRKKIKEGDIRVSCHPGQYTVINSNNPDIVKRSIKELEYHARIMHLLSGNKSHRIILHVGGVYDNKFNSMHRFIDVYNHSLSELIKKYLVIENDDRLYTVEDALYIAQYTSVPVVFDNLHHRCNPSFEDLSVKDVLNKVRATWPDDIVPKMHYSQQAHNKRMGAHSASIDLREFELDYYDFIEGEPIDIMLEVKDKNRSFIKVDSFLYPQQTKLEKEWARYKYLVMAHSIHSYNAIRALFKNNANIEAKNLYHLVDHALMMNLDIGNQINAMDHVWGYFKKECTPDESISYASKREKFRNCEISNKPIIRQLHNLANKYEKSYLLESYYFNTFLNR